MFIFPQKAKNKIFDGVANHVFILEFGKVKNKRE
jgi:hypothetical protein